MHTWVIFITIQWKYPKGGSWITIGLFNDTMPFGRPTNTYWHHHGVMQVTLYFNAMLLKLMALLDRVWRSARDTSQFLYITPGATRSQIITLYHVSRVCAILASEDCTMYTIIQMSNTLWAALTSISSDGQWSTLSCTPLSKHKITTKCHCYENRHTSQYTVLVKATIWNDTSVTDKSRKEQLTNVLILSISLETLANKYHISTLFSERIKNVTIKLKKLSVLMHTY